MEASVTTPGNRDEKRMHPILKAQIREATDADPEGLGQPMLDIGRLLEVVSSYYDWLERPGLGAGTMTAIEPRRVDRASARLATPKGSRTCTSTGPIAYTPRWLPSTW